MLHFTPTIRLRLSEPNQARRAAVAVREAVRILLERRLVLVVVGTPDVTLEVASDGWVAIPAPIPFRAARYGRADVRISGMEEV
jgi:hypothetical protein